MLFALTENNSIIDITDAIANNGHNYYCPACHEKLILKHGKKRRAHFAHKTNSECDHGYETALHLMAKKIVENADSFYLPEISFLRGGKRKDIVVSGQYVSFARVESEKWMGNIIPDVVGYIAYKGNEYPIAIEILVSHEVDNIKKEKIEKRKLRTIEIDLSAYKENDLSMEELSPIILGDSEKKYWIYNPKKEKKIEEYRSNGIKKKRHIYWEGFECYDEVHNCPNHYFGYVGNYYDKCMDCPCMVQLETSSLSFICDYKYKEYLNI